MYLYELLGWIGAVLIMLSLAGLIASFVDNAMRHRAMLKKYNTKTARTGSMDEYNETVDRR